MTLDEYEALEKIVTPDWKVDVLLHANNQPYTDIACINVIDEGTLKIDDARIACISRNTSKEVIALVRAAKKFVPDPKTIQWEQREYELSGALAAFELKLGEQ